MTRQQLRAMANFMINSYGAQAFLTAVERAKALSSAGHTEIAEEWGEIAVQVSEIETAAALAQVLDRTTG